MTDLVTLAAVLGIIALGIIPWVLLHNVWARYDAVLTRAVNAEAELLRLLRPRNPGADVTVRMLPDTAPLAGLSHRVRLKNGGAQ